jgi:hypothetical protein
VPLPGAGLAGARSPAGTAGLGGVCEPGLVAGCAPLAMPDPASRAMPQVAAAQAANSTAIRLGPSLSRS